MYTWLIANALCADYFAVYFALHFFAGLFLLCLSLTLFPGAGAFILNFCHSAMSIFGFGAPQIGCFSTKMQHLLPCRLQASIPCPQLAASLLLCYRFAYPFWLGCKLQCWPGQKGAHVPLFLRLFLPPQKPQILFIMSKGWPGARVAGLPFACPVFRFIKCSPCLALPCRMQLPIYFAKVCTSGLSRLFMGILFFGILFSGIRNKLRFSGVLICPNTAKFDFVCGLEWIQMVDYLLHTIQNTFLNFHLQNFALLLILLPLCSPNDCTSPWLAVMI